MFVEFSFSTMASVRQIKGGMSRMNYRISFLKSDTVHLISTVAQARQWAVGNGLALVSVTKDKSNVATVVFGDRHYALELEREAQFRDNPEYAASQRVVIPEYRKDATRATSGYNYGRCGFRR